MALSGDRTFTIGDGSAAVDLTVEAALVNGTTPGGLVKTGGGTMALTGANTYTGDTTVSNGTLSLATVSLNNGSVVDVANGAFLNLTHGLTDTVDSFYINGVQQAAGEWGATGSGAANQTARITGSGKLFVTSGEISSDPFAAWIDTFTSLTNPADKTKGADPDKDGLTNAIEFAFDGNPASGAASGKIRSRIETVGADQALVITLPVRAGAVFDNTPGPAADATIDNMAYTIAGSNDLLLFNQGVTEIAVSATGMPALTSASWTYKTFRLDGAVGGGTPRGPKGFLRVSILDLP
jgi:autotransporter-associated beta strand protein